MLLDEGKRRKISYVEKYFPFYISSIGCHMFNKMNQTKRIYTESGSVPSTRIHTLFVTFPGFGKSFFLRQFLDNPKYSLIKGSVIPTMFEGNTSEAGFTGQVRHVEGKDDPVFTEGLCQEQSNSIIGIEEFSAITNALKQTYNIGLDTSLLLALDSGNVVKRLGPAKIGYHTNLTLWAGVQPARYDLGSGFARRFIFMTFYPKIGDINRYRKSRREMKGIDVSRSQMNLINMSIGKRMEEVDNDIKSVSFSKQFYEELDNLDVLHYEDELFERMALGYWVMKKKCTDQLYITMDRELRRLIHLVHFYKKEVNTYSPQKIIWNMIRDEEKVKETTLFSYALALGFEVNEINLVLRTLYVYKKIKKDGKDLVIL